VSAKLPAPRAKKKPSTKAALGKTLYAQPSAELAERIERVRQLENLSNAQIVLESLDFWTLMSPETHVALRRVAQSAGRAGVERVVHKLARDLTTMQFEQTATRLATQLPSASPTSSSDNDGSDDATIDDIYLTTAMEFAK
jgi:hypothetical protein